MQSSQSAWKLLGPINELCKHNRACASKLQRFLPKQIWTKAERDEVLNALSDLFILGGDCVVDVCIWLGPLILEVVTRLTQSVIREGHSEQKLLKKIAVIMCKGFPISSELQRFAVDFVQLHKPFTLQDTPAGDEPPRKRAKKNKISDLDWCQAMWSYMVYLPETTERLDIAHLSYHLTSTDDLVRWYASCALSKCYGMSESETSTLLKKYFTQEEQRMLSIRVDREVLALQDRLHKAQGAVEVERLDAVASHTLQTITSADLNSQVVSVMGILLPRLGLAAESDSQISSPLVLVPSTQQHLRSLALAVSSCRPVLLQGPVGCGKTSLVEHLAMLTGRLGFPDILKIQLGDQTDSKALLGTYCSTEVPGEFVWRAGVLTQAVSRGSWVLLEDVDTAPMDVLSLLVALAETRTLMVPGHGDEIRAAPGFQLFTTQRLLGSSDGWHHQRGGNALLLEKLCTVINVEPLSRTELKHVIAGRFPALVPVSDKLLDIYFMLSAGRHNVEEPAAHTDSQHTHGRFLSTGGRQISTRDLMTWCSRSSVDFDHKEASQGLRVFLEAVDCFVSCISKQATRLSLASAVGTKLNITEDRSKYFCTEYKPSLSDSTHFLEIGRARVQRRNMALTSLTARPAPTFSYTRSSLVLLEKIAVCINRNEPVLLAGETGTGKTSTVQFLAHYLGHKLHVINLNQQSDSTDLLGGFKPVDLKFVMMPLREEFEMLFCETFSRAQNEKFLSHVQTLFSKRRWSDLLTLIEAPVKKAANKLGPGTPENDRWMKISKRINELRLQIREMENVLAFSFIEGTLVKALRKGDWVLLDEINLATAETLECLSGLLESSSGSIVLTERGDAEPIQRHPDFRLFACMNPATDVGKKDLPVGIRNRFTEFYVEELECPKDLSILVRGYLPGLSLTSKQVTAIVNFYLSIKNDRSDSLMDGTGHRPHFSLRTLCRALMFCARNPCRSVPRSMFEGFCLSFLTQLDRSSHPLVEDLIIKHILASSAPKAVLGQKLPKPEGEEGVFIQTADYWISRGTLEPVVPTNYILTPSVRLNLKDLARVVSAGKHAVLLQGETSVGKTSLITYLAQLTGNVCLRVNNHEHTDIQEYVGSYAADEHGKLVFKEGVLVEAMRKGYWIILDELNLAPTDVLEALNRLLDDNQELYIPETQEMVQAHPKFMLFATQNPPGLYGGRKALSRAFRNRFIELHFDEIPAPELETILHQRCGIPLSYAKKLVAVMLELQMRRRGSGIFSGKNGFMTLRDLFRWAQRYNCLEAGKGEKFYDWDQHLAEHGYMLLAGRVRKPEEEVVIKEVIEKNLKRKLQIDALYTILPQTSAPLATMLNSVTSQSLPGFQHIVWTRSMRRLAVLIGQAIRFKEPILLVGDTGVGKTTVCQLYSALQGRTLLSINCHMHTESADFLGGLRPVRSHDDSEQRKENMLFEWKDGPLVTAMKEGAMFLIDEISLADDSVLERLNSVLEPERTILLAEKASGGEAEVEKLQAAEHFQVFATMNPGGDFGKKELSPALRNRFTEIWCPQSHDRADLIAVIEKNIHPGLHLYNTQDGTSGFGHAVLEFVEWFISSDMGRRVTVSIRDILSWVGFINTCAGSQGDLREDTDAMETDDVSLGRPDPAIAYVHGACLVFIDSLGAGSTTFITEADVQASRLVCLRFLQKQLSDLLGHDFDLNQCQILLPGDDENKMAVVVTEQTLCIPPFRISRETVPDTTVERFTLQAPTTCVNGQRLLRALQLPRPVLLEGSPGVGKTSLVAAIARMARKTLVRINLSEQTDVTDLFGADLPVEGEEGGHFAWRDGPFLQALKAGHWVVFDELNLASQSVLEGLNACFDHRAEVYIPELGKTFHIQHEKTRIFACQNPLSQGGGRKGLPRSFLNRFTQVYVDPLTRSDLLFITATLYPDFPKDMLLTMVDFNSKMQEQTMVQKSFGGRGAPWEFNLRDLFRWCDLLQANQTADCLNPGEYVGLIYKDRMRTAGDKTKVDELYLATFDQKYPLYSSSRKFHIGHSLVQAGHSFLPRGGCDSTRPDSNSAGKCLCLHHSLEPLESLMKCVQMGWLTILVGPQSSGKTSLVKLLSKLTGHALCVLPMNSSMDTTELLGGFEQSDVWRHLGVITTLLQTEVRNLGKRSLLEKDAKESFLRLAQDWTKYRTLATRSEGLSSLEVTALFSQHLQKLQVILGHLESLGHSLPDKLSEIRLLLSHLSITVSNMKPGAGGGAFEWTDSMLVKALKNGDWLLIDNVNFCSASVLDRLNALLEPNGVLTINERGSVNGEIATVVPHPEFRLFFAMDPRYGEISRAMRNRGIEIYLLGEDEGNAYSQPDIFCMLEEMGLRDRRVCQWWLELHASLKSELPFSERPMIADLLHSGSLCVQLRSRGFNIRHAFAYAAEDGYVGNKRNAAAKQLARSIVGQHLEAIPENLSDASIYCTDLQAVTKSWVGEVRQLANVKRDATLILSTLERLSHNPSQTVSWRVHLQTAVLIFASLQSELSWKLALEWTETVIPTVQSNLVAVSSTEHHIQNVKFMLDSWKTLASDCLNQVFMGSSWSELTRTLEKVFAGSSTALTLLREQPWDLTFNPQASQHAALIHTRETGKTLEGEDAVALSNVQKLISRLQLIQVCVVTAHNLKDKINALEETISKAGRRKTSALPPLGLVSLLLSHVTEELPQLVESLDDASLVYLTEGPHHLLWLKRLADIALTWQNLHKDVFIAHLSLHWHWVEDRLRCLLALAQHHNPKVAMVMEELQRHLGRSDKSIKMHVKFWAAIGHPKPFISEKEAAVVQCLSQITSALTLCCSDSQLTLKRKVDAFTESGLFFQSQIQDIMAFIANGELSEAEKAIQALTSFLTRSGLMQACKEAPRLPENEADLQTDAGKILKDSLEGRRKPSQFVSLWPLFGHISLLAEMSAVSSQFLESAVVKSADASMTVDDVETVELSDVAPLRDFVLSHLPDLTDWSLVSRGLSDGHLLEAVQQLFSKLWTSPTCSRPLQWLRWSDHQDEFVAPGENMGPGVLHGVPVCRFAMHILSKNSEITNTVDLLPLHVSLGNLQEQAQEVSLMSRHIWCHSSALGNPEYDIRLLEKQLLQQSFMELMSAMHSFLTPNLQSDWLTALKKMQVSGHFTRQSFGELQNILSCSLHSFPSHISALLPRCLEVVHDAGCETSPSRSVPLVGHGLVYVGLLLAQFLSPKGSIDPVEKTRLKLSHVEKELEELEAELSTWNQHLEMRTGRGISETHRDHLHPRVLAQLQRQDKLRTGRGTLQQSSAYRPDQIQYIQLSQAIRSFMESSCSVSKITDLVSRLNNTGSLTSSHQGDVSLTAALQEERVWQDTTERFIQRLKSSFQCYMDIVVPFCAGVQEMKLGLRLLAHNCHKSLKTRKLGSYHNITSLVGTLCSFPTVSQALPDLLSLANQMSSSSVQDAIVSVLLSSSANDVKEEMRATKSRLLLCSLLLLKAHSFISRRLDSKFIATLSSVLDLFSSAWGEQEEQRKQKELEESALFKYKEQVHGDERSEHERQEADFRSAYPSFEKDFMDVTGAVRLEDVGLEQRQGEPADSSRITSLDGISPKEMAQVCLAHSEILITLSQADWLERNPLDCVADVLTPALMSYQIGATVVRTAYDVLDPETDGQVLGSHLLVGGSVLQYLELQNGSSVMQDVLKKPSGKSYNIYYDANVPEVMKCKAVIDSLRRRVRELQLEWPDHPTLVLLNQIMDRILSFSVTSTVVKFLTGLELLLQKAQDWESNASSSVSMASQLSEITAVIVSWRKLELSCWSSALDREEEKCKEKASHWWFHLFQVTSAFVTTDHSSDIKETDKAAILDALKKFMESSTMGEYSFRLQMLLAFHCQLLYMDSSPAQKHLVHILWNIHQFYKQYQPSVEAEIKRLRSPIDKQLKGFVKIARWSDLNYWALKTSTEKTHRTVHKYIKEYQAVLHQPAKSMLGDKGDDLVAQAVKQTAGFPLEEQTTLFTQCVTGNLRSAQADESSLLKLPSAVSDDVPLLCRMPSLFKKMKKHLIKYVAETRDVKMTLVFDDFTGELIQEIHELQGLQVDMSAEKEKQKSEARAFNLRKRKSLAELFKCLSEIGLSYRKGVSGKAGRGFSEALELPPLNLQAHPELAVTKLWTGCEAYFYRCISRYAQFSAAVVSPSKELTMADIERIRGFIEHFSLLYIEQRDRLSSLASSFLSLNKMLVSVKSLEKSSSYSIPPQTESHSWLAQVKQLTTQLSEGMLQFQLLLESCPSDHQHLSLVNVHPSPLPRSRLAPSAFWSRGDAAWTQCFNTLQIMVKNVRAEQTVIDKLLNKVILVRSDMETVSKILGAYKHLTSQLSEISSHFNQDSTGDKCCLVSTFSYLCSQISNIHDSFHVWYHKIGARPCVEGSEAAAGGSMQDSPTALVRDTHTALCDEFLSKTESLVEALLLSVQNVMKVRQLSVQDGAKDDDTEKSEELEEDLKEAHLTKHLLDVEKNVITHLGCDQISAKLQDLISSLCRRSDEASSSSSQSLMATTSPGSLALGCKFLLQSLPLVSAYCSLVENQLGLSVTLHRSMGKLLSVLLAVFTELSQKGFCIPPELSEEVAGEGATEFKDIESGGLGEGEGAKDVSDQIESEDQLEEARKPGQEDKAEDPQDQPDIPSEDNAIEMSDDFDGKLHNKDGADKEEDNENEANEDEDMEKQMGEADGEQNDRLDERMWGSDDEEEEGDGEDEKDTKDDQGAGGMDRQKEEMVAKDDNKDATEAQDDTEDDAQKDTEEKRQNELMEDDDDYDDNQVDPHNKEEKEEDAENLDLSTDLNLDDGEKNDKDAGDDNDDAENKDDDDANTNSDETPEQEPEAGKDENAEEVEDVQANKPEPQDLENNEDKSGEDNLQNMTAEKEEEKEGEGAEGASGQEEEKPTAELGRDEDDVTTSDDKVDTADDAGDVAQHTETADSLGRGLEQENTQQEEEATREKQDKKEEENIGAASSEDQEGHQGQQSSQKSDASGAHQQQVQQRNPGQSDNERSLGSHDKEHRRLKTKDESQNRNDEEQDTHNEDETRQTSLEYEHIKDAKSHCDAQTIDVASKEQMLDKQAVPSQLENEGDELEDEDDVGMEVDEGEMDTTQHPEKKPAKSKDQKKASSEENAEQATQKEQKTDTEGERVLTLTADRAPESSVHTLIENLHMDAMPQELDLDALRTQLEQCVSTWSHPQDTSLDVTHVALEAWQKYQTITGALSQELCEQLRLILEPSQATKLKGDYRTGKRLNMRKVIPYIASQFRKDKIWLRRSKPSKRLYQIMIAIDDSASMADNHSKQLAFESLALVSNALTLLESGELSVCSFGEDVRLLHPFAEPFSNQSGAKILQQLSCEQTQTKYGMLLDQVLAMFVNARSRLSSMAGDAETAQLLLILSDGNGVFREGMDVVRRAVRRARSAKIFLVFIILDNPERKSSILDSKVPIMEPSGQIREIKSYMEMFPFPFYILLRDINCMPQILSDALRQWFELVTSSDR